MWTVRNVTRRRLVVREGRKPWPVFTRSSPIVISHRQAERLRSGPQNPINIDWLLGRSGSRVKVFDSHDRVTIVRSMP